MPNPLRDSWGRFWGRLTGQGYYPQRYLDYNLDSETMNFVHVIWQYQQFEYEQALELLERQNLYPMLPYRHFKRRKDDGGFRELAEPDPLLKNIQTRILAVYLKNAAVHRAAMGYRPKLSIANHVWAHVGAKVVITADIQDFFPSSREHRIRAWWASQFASESAVELATLLTTYRGSLPQGAPTSPALSNLVNFGLDDLLSRKIERSGGTYTRYVDDMVFSWQGNYPPESSIRQSIGAALHEFGYELNAEKWHEYCAEDEPEITGVILRKHGKVTIPKAMQQKIKQLERNEPNSPRLAGYRGFQKMVEKSPRLPNRSKASRARPVQQQQASSQDRDWDDDYEDEDYADEELLDE
jgi:RNA-directed DNA polymerase